MEQRLPPQHVEAEQCVLGAIMLENASLDRIAGLLSADDFYKSAHSIIYSAMLDLSVAGVEIDVLTLTDKLKKIGQLRAAGGAAYVSELIRQVPSSANIKSHAKLVVDKAKLRRLTTACASILDAINSDSSDVDSLYSQAANTFLDIEENNAGSDFVLAGSLAKPILEEAEDIAESGKLYTGIETGFTKIDRFTGGLQDGELIIVGGRPSMGKTSLMLAMAYNCADRGDNVALFSLEMTSKQLVERLMCMNSMVNSLAFRNNSLQAEDWSRLAKGVTTLQDVPLYISQESSPTPIAVLSKCRQLKREVGLDIVFVDYIQLMKGNTQFGDKRQLEVSDISRRLKLMAQELGVPVVVGAQVNRSSMARQDPIPQLSDLRESGSIEQDADVVLFLHRPEALNVCKCSPDLKCSCESMRGQAQVRFAKNRNGNIGNVRLGYHKQFTLFHNL